MFLDVVSLQLDTFCPTFLPTIKIVKKYPQKILVGNLFHLSFGPRHYANLYAKLTFKEL